ncbi:hypothetical protein O181_103770 [Austropuccinia psidii MF-1]|uniref:Uncharacterized protein n=1 Tax=Austropuccinia psidii MF-1 TaxID=1389203 RepID=A0A9Q3JM82_9BASI|nr:hypothetical protein [Austropuccinia psidii MF-1]
MVTSLLDQSEVIIRPMKDGDGERTFELGPIITMSCHRWDSNAKFALQANPAATHSRPKWHLMVGGIIPQTLSNQKATYSWPSPSSPPPEDVPTCEPEPEVAPTQSTEESFARRATPRLIIIVDDTPVGSPLPVPPRTPTPPPSGAKPLSFPR